MRFERTGCTAPQLSVAVNPPRQRTPCLLLPPRPKDVDLLRNSVRGAAASSESVMRHAKHTSTRMNSLVCDMRVSAHCCIISLQGNEFLSGSPGLASIEQARRVSSASRLNPRTSWCEQVVRSAVALKHEQKIARATEWLECGGCCCTDLDSPASTLSCTRSGVTHNCIHGRACGQRGPAVAAMLACGQGLNKSSSQVEASHPNGG